MCVCFPIKYLTFGIGGGEGIFHSLGSLPLLLGFRIGFSVLDSNDEALFLSICVIHFDPFLSLCLNYDNAIVSMIM